MGKPIEYADIPEFDQSTQYVIQAEPVDMGEYIYYGVQILNLPKDEPM